MSMKSWDDPARLAAVQALGSLLAPPLQELCKEAQAHFGVDHVSIHLVGVEQVVQQTWAGRCSIPTVRRDASLCAQVIIDDDARTSTWGALVAVDLSADVRWADMKTQHGFFAGVAIKYANGGSIALAVGTLCLYSEQHRDLFSTDDCKKLHEYGEKVTAMLASPLPSLGKHPDHSLHSLDDRVRALMVSVAPAHWLVFAFPDCFHNGFTVRTGHHLTETQLAWNTLF